MCAKPMLLQQVEQERPEQADLAACRLGQRGHEQAGAAGDGEQAADDHLADLVGLAALEAPPFPEGGDRDEHREAEGGIERDQPARRHGVAHERQVELLVAPDEVGVEDLLVGQERDRHHRDQDAEREHPEVVLAIEIPGQVEIECADQHQGADRSDDPGREQEARDHQPDDDERGDADRAGDDPADQLAAVAVGDGEVRRQPAFWPDR